MISDSILVLAIWAILNLSCVGGHDYELERKVDKLIERVDLLTNEIERDNDEKRCIRYEDIPEEIPTGFPDILPLEARRKLIPTYGLLLTFKYWSNAEPAIATWRRTDNFDKIQPEENNAVAHFAPGVSETKVLIPLGVGFQVLLDVAHPTKLDTLRLKFNTSSDSPAQVTCIPLPVFRKETAGDVVYQPGSDVTLKLTIPPPFNGESWDNYYRYVTVETYLYNPDTGEVGKKSGNDEEFSTSEGRKFLDSQEVFLHWNTSDHPRSGLVLLRVSDGRPGGDLIKQTEMMKTTTLRPSDQGGPYPAGYLGFVRFPYLETSSDGTQVSVCDRMSTVGCFMFCMVVGTGIESLQMFSVSKDGTREKVTDFLLERQESDVFKALNHKVLPKSEDEAYFQCEATNSAGVVKVQNTKMSFYTEATIDQDRSGFSKINDSSIELSCVAIAEPDADVNLTFSLWYTHNDTSGLQPDEIEYENGTIIGTKVVDLEYEGSDYDENLLISGECILEQSILGAHPGHTPPDHFYFVINRDEFLNQTMPDID